MDAGINKIGFRFGMLAFAANLAFVIAQTLQLLRVLKYPFDEILIYGFSLCIVIPFVLEMLAFYYMTPNDKKYWAHAALIFTVIYAIFVAANYVVQLSTVIPMSLRGCADKIEMLVQTPHSLFWDFDAIGYISMGFATLFGALALENHGFQRWVRLSFFANAAVTPLIAFVYFYPDFTETILLFGVPWMITAPAAMLLLAVLFKKDGKEEDHKPRLH